MNIRAKLREFFSLDYRSLALLRMAMGTLIILDLISRAQSLTAHYTDAGVLPRATLFAIDSTSRSLFSLHTAFGSLTAESVLFAVAGIFALMLIVGYRTRLATIVSWFLLISLQARNPLVLQGGDILFRGILFWMLFLPVEARWSIDRLLGKVRTKTNRSILSAATVIYIAQIVLFYVESGLMKTGLPWQNGTAVYYALSVSQLARPLGTALRNWYWFGHVMTYLTLSMEVCGPILFFMPYDTGFFRTIGVLLFALMQIGFNISFHLGYFGAISIAATVGLLPAYFWDTWMRNVQRFFLRRAQTPIRMYFDQDCSFCSQTVLRLKKWLFLGERAELHPAQENAAMFKLMQKNQSWVVLDAHGSISYGFQGFSIAVRSSPVFGPCARVLELSGIKTIGERIYAYVSRHRSVVCVQNEIHAQVTGKSRIRTGVKNAIVIFFGTGMILWNLGNITNKNYIPENMQWIVMSVRLDQVFDMFAPSPLTSDGKYAVPGTLKNGSTVSLFSGTYADQRWQKYMMNLETDADAAYRTGYAQYLCRTWNMSHADAETLVGLKIFFNEKDTPAPGMPFPSVKQKLLLEYTC